MCLCVRLFYFKYLFHSNYWGDLNHSWQVAGYTMPKYESKILGLFRGAALSYFPWTRSVWVFIATPRQISTKFGALLETACENVNKKFRMIDVSSAKLFPLDWKCVCVWVSPISDDFFSATVS